MEIERAKLTQTCVGEAGTTIWKTQRYLLGADDDECVERGLGCLDWCLVSILYCFNYSIRQSLRALCSFWEQCVIARFG